MDSANDPSSSPSFGSSSYVSNGSSYNNIAAAATFSNDPSANSDHMCLSKLSASLEKLVVDSDYDYTDAVIVVEGIEVGVHRCILAARSRFFHELFKQEMVVSSTTKDGKPKYCASQLVPFSKIGVEAFKVILNYLYTGKLKASPPEVSTCVDEACAHDACGPAVNYAVELMFASATFKMKEMVLLVQRRLLDFVEKASVEDVMTILIAAHHCHLDQLLSPCIQRVAKSDLDAVSLERELSGEVASEIQSLRKKSQTETNFVEEVDLNREKKIRRLHKALDCDDVELMKLLLTESSDITLNDAYALHYATAYCDPKVIKEVINLGLADLNLKNPRGQTILHVAARRKDPKIIVALLDKGTSALEPTSDGQTAVTICRRLTRPKDYNETTRQCHESNKDRLCIDVLEREMRRNSISGCMEMDTQISAADMHVMLDYLENRVAFARLFFPAEAKVAMDTADAYLTVAYTGPGSSKSSSGNSPKVVLNETPSSVGTKKLQSRMQALMKTVDTGRRFFPHCSEVLDNFLADDMPDLLFLEKGTPEEQRKKKARFMELKDDVQKALTKDLAEKHRSVLSSSSSSSSPPKPSSSPSKPSSSSLKPGANQKARRK